MSNISEIRSFTAQLPCRIDALAHCRLDNFAEEAKLRFGSRFSVSIKGKMGLYFNSSYVFVS